MKIGISCHGFGHGGGIERYTMDLVNGLHALGIRPVVFAKSFDTSIPEYAWIEPVRISVRGWPGKLRDHVFSHRLQKLKRLHNVDLLIACNRTTVSDIAICGGTHIGHILNRKKPAGFWDRRQINLERQHYAHASVVVAHAELMAAELREHYQVEDSRIHVLYPPIDAQRFSPVDADERLRLRTALGLPTDRVVFLFPSSSHVRKGLPQLAAYFAQSTQPILLAVLGRPVDQTWPNVQYLGYHPDIENAYRAADYAILASRYEPFGLVGPEAVLCGTPAVLASNVGCTEVLSADAVMRFELDDPASLAACIGDAVARVQRGDGRLTDPRSHLSYDPDMAAHARAILSTAGACPTVQA
ncbi:glycosyltransferase family 4 protein [Pigmentiphaga aceris]|uniref:Glycosyltransferase family 4 protein n=1 Tax=Pigmentiphaga aceris TaxID=1940612 RepID=A0A5C0B2N8_9BURK|nr:glycosyltransferase family 4 protein [Pigmentiphaga aceris]QEI07450.1 glycosyltransferase family 4 protein [Pigmentiphaga aceris]